MNQPKDEVKASGTKFDSDKPILALLPPKALWQVGQAFSYGAKKYGHFNHMGGIAWIRLLSAALRHIFQFISGEDYDVDPNCEGCINRDCKMHSGLPHWANACANLMMLGEQHMRGNTKMDDRYKE
jgi:hypothetical protein